MNQTPAPPDTEVIYLRVPKTIKRDLEALAVESGKSSLNAFLLPFLNAVRRGDMRMVAVSESEKLLPERACNGCKK